MSRRHRIGRREFMMTSAGVVSAGLEAACGRTASLEAIEEAASKVGRLPRRKLGGSDREVSVLVGAGTWAREAVEAGILCGVNYWHKADEWESSNLPRGILKNREEHYCEVCVDRVRGNHETGTIDEEAHYQFVKQAVKQTGLRYFDDMMFHFGYHTVVEARNNRAFIRAFERLKREGLVLHLCLSQHSYLGSSRVPGGEAAHAILTAVMEDGVYEHAQFFYSYGEDARVTEFVHRARQKGFGTTAMKTGRGVSRMRNDAEFMKNFPERTTPHHALARWLTTGTELTAAVIQINSLEQFVDTFSGAGKPMRPADSAAIQQMTAYANREVCRLCNECMPHCNRGVPIAEILRYERYARDYHDDERARFLYARLEKKADSCDVCGACLTHCPQRLQIPEMLGRAHRLLSA